MKHKLKRNIAVSVGVGFTVLTLLVIIYALQHRDRGDLIYLVFNAYALLAIVMGMFIVQYFQQIERIKQESSRNRLRSLTQDMHFPAMLWNDSFTQVVMNSALLDLTEMTVREDFQARTMVAMMFSRKTMTEADIQEVTSQKAIEYAFTAASGKQHEIVWNTSTVYIENSGMKWFLSIGMDLADIRMMQHELADYSKRLSVAENMHNLTIDLMDVGLLVIEQGNPNMFPSIKLRQMLGIAAETITLSELREKVYPLDIVKFDNHIQNMRNRMREYLDRSDVVELRLSAATGEYRWYSYRFRVSENPQTHKAVIGGTIIDITKEKEKDAQIERIAYEDAVTHIPNRSKLMQMGNEIYRCTAELHSSYWVIVMDIDRFHLINDTCGYAAGNELLKQFADALKEQVKPGGFGARISGDNFALILRETGDAQIPVKVVRKIQSALATKAVGALSNHSLTCSAGYARMPEDGDSFEHVLEHAEFALSADKEEAGTISRYTSVMHDSIIWESTLETQLSEAAMRGELILYYQPKISLETGALVGMEALVRWQRLPGQMVPPGIFIPIAERSQLITQITQFVLDEACRQTKAWQEKGLPTFVMSINFSSTDFYQDNVCAQIERVLQKYDLDAQYLEIELTESLALKDIDMTISRMNELREAGIQIAMDDFGTGYSSLSYFQRLPFTMVKLDRSFVIHMEEDPVMMEIVSSVARIAKAKNITTIAEGVETPAQARLLRAAGCDFVQGYLYGKPMNAEDTEAFMRENMKHKIVY